LSQINSSSITQSVPEFQTSLSRACMYCNVTTVARALDCYAHTTRINHCKFSPQHVHNISVLYWLYQTSMYWMYQTSMFWNH